MSFEGQKFDYPGEESTPQELLSLADEYKRAAGTLLPTGRAGEPLSRAPYRLVAIHAIELYLNAFLIAAGEPPERVRGYQHNLEKRIELARSRRLILRKRTAAHLVTLTSTREYLASRYHPGISKGSQLNRLEATLNEVADKVYTFINLRA